MAERFSFVLNICERFEGKYYTMRQSRENITGEQQVSIPHIKSKNSKFANMALKL